MLDAVTAGTVRDLVDEVTRRRSLTLVVVEHRLTGWVDLVDRLVVLDAGGAVIADDTPGVVLADHGKRLVAEGIWVPGVADPEPLDLRLTAWPRSSRVAAGRLHEGGVARDHVVTFEGRGLVRGFPGTDAHVVTVEPMPGPEPSRPASAAGRRSLR